MHALETGAEAAHSLSATEMAVPSGAEIVLLEYSYGAPFPGVYLFTQPARMMRPVVQSGSGLVEMIGTLEQSTLDIACQDGGTGGSPGLNFTHRWGQR